MLYSHIMIFSIDHKDFDSILVSVKELIEYKGTEERRDVYRVKNKIFFGSTISVWRNSFSLLVI